MLNKAIELGLEKKQDVSQLKANYFHNKGEYSRAIQEFEKLWKNESKDFRYYELKIPFYYRNDDFFFFFKS